MRLRTGPIGRLKLGRIFSNLNLYMSLSRERALGRGELFANYRLRIAEIVRHYGPEDRAGAPNDTALAVG